VRVWTDGTPGSPTYGQAIAQQGSYPYGESWYTTGSGAPDNFIFTSYERDQESGLDYAMARYYDSTVGRFCSADPLGGQPDDPQSWNRYAYVRNDPVNMTDPSGQGWLSFLIDFLVEMFLPEVTPAIFGQAAVAGDAAFDDSFIYSLNSEGGFLSGTLNTTVNVTAAASAFPTTGAILDAGLTAGAVAEGAQTALPKQPGLKERLKDDLKKPNCNKLLGGPQKASQILSHLRGVVDVGNDVFTQDKFLIDNGSLVARTEWYASRTTMQWSGGNFTTYVGSGNGLTSFMNMSPSAQETVMIHEFIHIAKGASNLMRSLVDLKTPNVPGVPNANRAGNIYEISKDCGTALPFGY
jgi:RHS repeat-associated protein